MRTPFSRLGRLNVELLKSRSLLTACIGHLSVDVFSGMQPLVLLLQKDLLGLSYAQVGLVSMTFSLASSVTQPFFGLLGDRWGHTRLMVIGAAIMGPSVGLMLVAHRFDFLLALALLSGLASGSFHPQGAVVAAQTSAERRGSAVSIFMFGGNLGYAFGPLVASFVLAFGGSYLPAILGLLGVALAGMVYRLVRSTSQIPGVRRQTANPAARSAALSLVITVILVVFLRSWVQSAVSTYVPQFINAQGGSAAFAGNVLFAILLPLAIGGLIGGTLSDRIGRRRVLIVSTALIGPALWALLHADGLLVFLIGPVLGVAIGASIPVSIVMTQELVPRGLGLMSGIAMGLSFVSGAIGVWGTGLMADQLGLLESLTINSLLPLGAAILAFMLPADGKAKQRATATSLAESD